MRLGPLLNAHSFMKVERPPALWEAATEDTRFVPLLGEIIAAGLSGGAALEALTLNASNVVIEPPRSDEHENEHEHEYSLPLAPPGEYVAVTISGETTFGDDSSWRTPGPASSGLLKRLQAPLITAGVVYAYTRHMPPRGSVTVLLRRQVSL